MNKETVADLLQEIEFSSTKRLMLSKSYPPEQIIKLVFAVLDSHQKYPSPSEKELVSNRKILIFTRHHKLALLLGGVLPSLFSYLMADKLPLPTHLVLVAIGGALGHLWFMFSESFWQRELTESLCKDANSLTIDKLKSYHTKVFGFLYANHVSGNGSA